MQQSKINVAENWAKPFARHPYLSIAIWVIVFSSIYFLYFTRQFLRGDIVMGGDTQLLWSLNYLALYSLANFGEFLWWDPTALNGWPAYVNLTSGWFNYMGPYSLPSVALFLAGNSVAKIDVNAFLVIQKTLYYFALNVLAVILISRELVKSPLARLLPPLVFTLSAIQFHSFRDSVLYEVMPAPLFYVFALIYYNNRRTPTALVMLLLFTGLFIANLNYGALQTSVWWTTAFTVFLLVFHPDIPRSMLQNVRDLRGQPERRALLWMMPIFLVAAFLAFYVPVHFNLGELVRVPGAGAVDYNVGVYGGFRSGKVGQTISALSHPVWTNFLYWSPFEVIHDFFLLFDDKGGGAKAGVDHRYIGLATLPLLFAAVLRGYRNKYVLVLLLTAFTCSAFITYTSRNLLVYSLAELLPLLRNIRTIADTLPRDAPIICLALVAGIGLDLLVGDFRTKAARPASAQYQIERLLRWILIGFALFAIPFLLISFFPVSSYAKNDFIQRFITQGPKLPELKEAFAHIGVYLFLFSLLCLMLVLVRHPAHKRPLAIVLLALAFFDLTISASIYWQRGLVWFENAGPHALPQIKRFAPVNSALQTWPGSYGGFINNPFAGPFVGLRSWLPLATRPEWQPVLENWDSDLRIIKKYPDFRFYSGGTYIPFDRIMSIDSVLPPAKAGAQLYVHDPALAKEGPQEKLDAQWEVTAFTPNRVRVKVSMPKDGVMIFLDNYDRFWSATVDEASVPVQRANFTFKAIALSAGEHQIEWSYSPFPVKAVWVLFYGALALVLLTMVRWRLRASFLLISASVLVWIVIQYAVSWHTADRGKIRADTTPQLAIETGRTRLRLENGKEYTVVDGMAGYVEGVFPDATGLTKIIGWAVDETTHRPPLAVVVTIGNRVWISGRPTQERPDIAASNPGYRFSGFQVFGRGASNTDLANLRAFSILANGTAVEFRYSKGVQHDGGQNY